MSKPYLLLPALLLAGCRSEQVAFQAPPAPASVVVAAPSSLATSATIVASRPAAALVSVSAPVTQPVHSTLVQRRAQRPVVVAALPVATLATPPAPARPRLLQRLALRKLATSGSAHTTESGLGGTVLFILAVVLALLAGLAALFALIPGVSFWGGLGLAVGALLIIGLLYSLLSGGKKK